MLRKSAVLLFSLALVPAAAWAQSGTEAEQEACTPDVFRLCSSFIPDEGPILACLQAKHAQLSAACEPVIFPHKGAQSTRTTEIASAAPQKRHRRHRSAI